MSEWRPVLGYEQFYEVSDDGQVRRKDGRLVGQWPNDQGYRLVRLSNPRTQWRVHRLVALAFIPNPNGLLNINHINNNRADNRAENIEWCTQKENLAHARRQGRMLDNYWAGKRSPSAKLDDETVRAIRAAYADGDASLQTVAEFFGVSKRSVGRIVHREVYADV